MKFTITKKEQWYALSLDTEGSSDKVQHPLQVVKKPSLRVWGKGSSLTPLVGMRLGAATVESGVGVLRKLEAELPCDPATPLLGVCPEKTEALIWKDACTPSVHRSPDHNSQDTEAA